MNSNVNTDQIDTELADEQTATVVITHQVKEDFKSNYEAWLNEIIPVSKSYPGHLGVSIVHPYLVPRSLTP